MKFLNKIYKYKIYKFKSLNTKSLKSNHCKIPETKYYAKSIDKLEIIKHRYFNFSSLTIVMWFLILTKLSNYNDS